jgi:hypothetical protein
VYVLSGTGPMLQIKRPLHHRFLIAAAASIPGLTDGIVSNPKKLI